ncbi:hypothetical protein LguiA_005285 [Lonicera macranthoides]
MVQMRGPLRNYEPVGAPMLALIQVERVFVPPKLKIYNTVSETMISNKDEDKCDPAKNEIKEEAKQEKSNEEEVIPQFKITDVHVAGFKNETGKKKLLGSKTQQQCGSHWLLANGMGKNNKVSGDGFADNLRILERVGIFSNWFNSCKRERNLCGINQILDCMLQSGVIVSVMSKTLVINTTFISLPARGSQVRGARVASGCRVSPACSMAKILLNEAAGWALVRQGLVDGRGDLLVVRKGFLSLSSLRKFFLGFINNVYQNFVSVEVLVTHAALDFELEILDNYPQLLFLGDSVD